MFVLNNDYFEKLKDPRWQKKRLQILERDKWTCQKCFDNGSTLNVHHKHYLKNKAPWDYPDELLVTLCDDCHDTEKANTKNTQESILYALRTHFLTEDITEISIGFYMMEIQHPTYALASAIGWALSNQNMQHEIFEKYLQHLKSQKEAKANGKI